MRDWALMRARCIATMASLLCVVGCEPSAPAKTPARAIPAPPAPTMVEVAAADAAKAKAEERVLPTSCEGSALCTPPIDFAERLCAGVHLEVALHLFAPKTPWKRAYLQRAFKAWHVGGRGELRDLRAGEEVIIVKTAQGAAQGGGADLGGQAFDVLRWDGTCVSLMEDELSFRRPPAAVPANIPWKKLEPAFQSAFAADPQVELSRASQVRICEGAAAEKEPGKTKCELARRQLSLAIAQSVGRGQKLPPLSSVP